MALEALKTSEKLDELANAAEVLALLNKAEASSSSTTQACKHISKLVYEKED